MALPCSESYIGDNGLKLAQKDTTRDGEGEGQGCAKLTQEEVKFLPPFPSSPKGKVSYNERERVRYSVATAGRVTA